jgi:VWFA-related protein
VKHAEYATATLIAALTGLALSAQNAAQQPAGPVIRANVRQVLVPVVVTDQKGHHVTDLKQSDFKLFEDGVPEEIVAFRTTADFTDPEVGQAAGLRNRNGPERSQGSGTQSGTPRRTYLICVDALHSTFPNFNRVRDAIDKVLKREESSESQYTLVTLGRQLRIVQDYTSDASAIAVATRSPSFQKAFQDREVANTAISVQQFSELMRSYCAACPCQSNGGGSQLSMCTSIKLRIQALLLSFGERTYAQNRNFLAQLDGLVRATENRPNSRTIIFISDGFNRFLAANCMPFCRAMPQKIEPLSSTHGIWNQKSRASSN